MPCSCLRSGVVTSKVVECNGRFVLEVVGLLNGWGVSAVLVCAGIFCVDEFVFGVQGHYKNDSSDDNVKFVLWKYWIL